ncbi:hypothetical protein IW262DRAFT_525685 [Armillaria fumosa]|nr:hypothetical protein IW262DRAFT_525685 [Armillaria fumosa]
MRDRIRKSVSAQICRVQNGPSAKSRGARCSPFNLNLPHILNTMFDFARTMLASSSHNELAVLDDVNSKSRLYCRQQYSVQIIQLVEGPPPPRQAVTDDSYTSSSSSYASASDSEGSSICDDGDEESIGSSYCSSDEGASSRELSEPGHERSGSPGAIRMKRILAWRANFSTNYRTTMAGMLPYLYVHWRRTEDFVADSALSSPLKRKSDSALYSNEHTLPHTSKRSRSSSRSEMSTSAISCAACDSFFDTQQSLRRHGQAKGASEACSVAVQYAFE